MVYEVISENQSIKEQNLSIISEVKLEFRQIQSRTKLQSHKFTVPGIDASWCFEVYPVYPITRENPTFPSAGSLELSFVPEIKLKIEFHDETISISNLFTLSVQIRECLSNRTTVRTNFVNGNVVNINSKSLEISSKSFENEAEEYKYNIDSCNLKFNLQCKLTFRFIGDFAESFTDAVKVLRKITSNSIGNLLKNDSFSDFTIIAGGESFKVHKCILANASSVFKTMFTCGLDETKLNSTTFNCKPEILGHFLWFIYEGALPSNEQLKSSSAICIDLYELAHRYEIRVLKAICKRYAMQLTVNPGNATKVYEFASTYEIQSLLDTSWEIVRTKLLDIEGPCNPISLPKVKELIAKKAELLEIFKRTKELLLKSVDEVAVNPLTGDETQPIE